MGGGPSPEQKAAAASQANLTSQQGAIAGRQQQFFENQQNKVNPFYTQRMNQGLPYYDNLVDSQSGTNAQAFAPARANLLRSLGPNNGLPSGFRQQSMTDLDSQQARSFDSGLVGAMGAQEQAKQAGASGLLGQAQIANPSGYFSGAMQGNTSILNANGLQRPGIAGVLGGLAGGAASSMAF